MPPSNSGTRQLSLFVPELFSGLRFFNDIPKQEVPNLPALQLLLTRSTTTKEGFNDYSYGVCSLAGIDISAQHDVPLAAISVAVDSEIDSNKKNNTDYFIFAEPVVLKADRDSVVLLDSLLHELTLDESERLIAEINQHFVAEPWELQITSNGEWYMILHSNFDICTCNISSVILQNTQDFLPKGKDARYWRKIINEIEMLLFASNVNVEREQQSKATVTSLWLWAGGSKPKIINKSPQCDLISADENSLAALSGYLTIPFKTANDVFAINAQHEIIVILALQALWRQRDLFSWIEALKILEKELFEPIVNCLRKGELDVLSLYEDKKNKVSCTRRNIKSWWKPVKPLTTLSSLL